MNIILGGTGHVGSATVTALLARGAPVTIVTRDGSRADPWRRRGAQVAVADVHDVASLRRVFRQGRRLFLVNPPADPATDTDLEERSTGAAIVAALTDSGLEKIVMQSTYGAQPGERRGDLTTLYELERAVQAQPIPVSIIRAAYYMSNWDFSLATAQNEGVLQTFFPADFALPMVAPQDLGEVAARSLSEPVESIRLLHVEGPARYTPTDVSAAFASALRNPVHLVVTPREAWKQTFESMGFSERAADSYARMTAVTIDHPYEMAEEPERGRISLEAYVAELVARQSKR
jgi:uncharacterized protein YbjT (DUF2867 family)